MSYPGAPIGVPVYQQPAYNYNAQPGLLQPGQIINVNGVIVTVERYLSQGTPDVHEMFSQLLMRSMPQVVLLMYISCSRRRQ